MSITLVMKQTDTCCTDNGTWFRFAAFQRGLLRQRVIVEPQPVPVCKHIIRCRLPCHRFRRLQRQPRGFRHHVALVSKTGPVLRDHAASHNATAVPDTTNNKASHLPYHEKINQAPDYKNINEAPDTKSNDA